MVRYTSKWVFAGIGIMPLAGLWYLFSIPSAARAIAFGGAPAVTIFLGLSLGISVFLLVFTWWAAWRTPARFSPALASLFLVVGFTVTATSEWVREAVRKPYVIYNVMYSNGLRPSEVETISRDGFLPVARWSSIHEITASNRLEAGKEIFRFECANCHTLDGYNAIRPLIQGWRESFITGQLKNLSELKGFMPPFAGTEEERRVAGALPRESLGVSGREPADAEPGGHTMNPILPAADFVPLFRGRSGSSVFSCWSHSCCT